jgi:cardiolipin synthase A/B
MKTWLKKNKAMERADNSEPWLKYCRYPETLLAGNNIELLVDGQNTFDSMIEAISQAQQTILMASYIFHDGVAGRRFASALAERSRSGVQVYLIVDGVGTFHVPTDFFDRMKEEGIRVLVYRRPALWKRNFSILRRDHRKLLVVDGRIGFAGGINVGAEWLPKEQGGGGWHDIHVRLEGPAVRELAKLAVLTWRVRRGIILDQRLFLPQIAPIGGERINVIGSHERKKRAAIRQSYLTAIKRARDHIYIANAYFLPGMGFRRALKNAVKRGVDVRVMVPENGDILSVQRASEALYGRLLRAGVQIFLWRDTVLHAKTATIDDQWATVGSFNIDRRSWRMNLEVNVNTVGSRLSTQLKEIFILDQKRCRELDRKQWRQRPLWMKLTQRFFYLFRRMM